nr:MAG TPA: Hemolysin [Bacteriophage sp.]
MSEWVSTEVFTETMRRIDAEDNRQNTRLTELEVAQKQISELITSVKVLANNMESMAKEQVKQGVRLQAIEEKPGKRWDTVIACIITGLVSAAISAAVSGFVR